MATSRLDLVRPHDVHEFERAAGEFLAAREAEHNLMLGICSGLRLRAPRLEPYFAVVSSNRRVVGASLHTPPFNVVLSAMDDEGAIPLIVDDLVRLGAPLRGVLGRTAESAYFARAWTERTRSPHHLHMSERIFKLTTVAPPRPVPGALRSAEPRDRDLLSAWLRTFAEEALGERHDAGTGQEMADRWLEHRDRAMYLWEDRRAVSICGVSGETPNGIRVAPVYTPPELRGRGYATACVAAVSQAQLDAGRKFCFLFTDLANPTSNRIYQRIGYEPVCDVSDYRFG